MSESVFFFTLNISFSRANPLQNGITKSQDKVGTSDLLKIIFKRGTAMGINSTITYTRDHNKSGNTIPPRFSSDERYRYH